MNDIDVLLLSFMNNMDLTYRLVASSSPSRTEAHAGLFRKVDFLITNAR